MQVQIHGLEAKQGEPAFAFLVLRLARAVDRDALVQIIRSLAPLVPSLDNFLEELPEELEEPMQFVGVPWSPPEPSALEAQRALVESAASSGVEAVWFFQTGTSLPDAEHEVGDDEDEDDEDDEDDDDVDPDVTGAHRIDFGAEDAALASLGGDDVVGRPLLSADDVVDDDAEDAEDDVSWSHGPPPQLAHVRFPVDGYPDVIDNLDWEDFGISFKLAGEFTPGEATVLLGFQALWLAPYGGRYRNAAVAVDRKHHAAHMWVDRFAVPCSAEEQVQHLLWIVSKIDEVTPVLHARFGGANMAQKYGGLMGDTSEPFVLGGNPLRSIHAAGGDAAIDAWIDSGSEWSKEEIAQMLCELAIEVVTEDAEPSHGLQAVDEDEVEALFEAAGMAPAEDGDDDDDADADDEPDADDEAADEAADDAAAEPAERQVSTYAGELLVARAQAGLLDPKAAEALRPVLATAMPDVQRRGVIGVLAALRDRASVPALLQLLDQSPTGDDAVVLAAALGSIGDPAAVPSLARLAARAGVEHDASRAAAARALAACQARLPEPPIDDHLLDALLQAIERTEPALAGELQLAYAALAQQLPPARRDAARARLEQTSGRGATSLALPVALALCQPAPDADTLAALKPLVHAAFTTVDPDHATTLREIRTALTAAEALPDVADAVDVVPLTRFIEADVRDRAHALLERLRHPTPRARLVDRSAALELADAELVRLLGDPHVVGRTALIAEAGHRRLLAAREPIRAAIGAVIERQGIGARVLPSDAYLFATAGDVLEQLERAEGAAMKPATVDDPVN